MIEVRVKNPDTGRELAIIQIDNVTAPDTFERGDYNHSDYSVAFGVDTAEGFAVYQRSIYAFPRKDLNVLALIKLALETLHEKELSLDGDPDNPSTPDDAGRASDLARRLYRALQ